MTEPTSNLETEATPVQQRGMRTVIYCQCLVAPLLMLFNNNLILLYLAAKGVDSAQIVFLLSFPQAIGALFTLPGAWIADRVGNKRVGFVGLMLEITGLVLIVLTAWVDVWLVTPIIFIGCVTRSLGFSVMGSSWLSLLSGIVPEKQRGRFFGKLRTSWQTIGLIFAGVCAVILSEDSPISIFVSVFAFVLACLLIRFWFYGRIPELTTVNQRRYSLKETIQHIIRLPGYVSFSCYVFLLTVFTAGGPAIFGIIEKRVLNLGDDQIVILGGVQMAFSILGFLLGGKAVDRFTTKPVFLVCHFGYALAILLFVTRDMFGGSPFLFLAAAHAIFGIVMASSSIAITTEILALISSENKSIAVSFCKTLQQVGVGISGSLGAAFVKMGMLREEWTILNVRLSDYDTVLLGFGAMVILLVITLGLVPSVISKHAWIPRSSD